MEPCSVAAPVAPHGACPPHNNASLHPPSCKVSPPPFFPAPPRRLFERDRTGRASARTEPLSKTFACGSPEIPSWGEGGTNLQGNARDLNAKEVRPGLRHIALLRPSRERGRAVMFVAPREPSRRPAGHSIRRRSPELLRPRGRCGSARRSAERSKGSTERRLPLWLGRASYNIVPRKSWLTESRVLRIPAKTEAIQSQQGSVLGFRVGATTWRSDRVFRAGISQALRSRCHPSSPRMLSPEEALRGSPHERIPQRSAGQQCRGCAMGLKIRPRAHSVLHSAGDAVIARCSPRMVSN